MAGEWDSLEQGFGSLGELLYQIFRNEMAMYFVVLVVVFILINSVLRGLLSKIPFFGGTGDRTVNAQGSVVSVCLALLMVIAIGWNTRGSGAAVVVDALAGPWGFFLIVGLTILAAYSTYKATENSAPWARRAWTFGVGGFIYSYMTFAVSGGFSEGGNFAGPRFGLFIFIAIIVGTAAMLTHLRR